MEVDAKNLSLGQKQRIIMLRLFSLTEKPSVIILDEALSGTDEVRKSSIVQKIREQFADSKIFFVTHRTNSFKLCDAVLNWKPARS